MQRNTEPGATPRRGGSARVVKAILDALIVLAVARGSESLFEHLTAERIVDVRAFNTALKEAVSQFSPAAMAESFATRLGDEHGWRFLSAQAPFNVTAARARAAQQFPLAAKRAPFLVDLTALGRSRSVDAERPLDVAAYRDALAEIDRSALPGWMPGVVQKAVGLPDAFLFMLRRMFARGWLSILIGGLTLVIAGRVLMRFGPGGIIVLPLVTTTIAWILFLPVLGGAALLNWVVVHLFGTPLTAPEASVLATVGSYLPINWATHKLTEHHLTEALLAKVHGAP